MDEVKKTLRAWRTFITKTKLLNKKMDKLQQEINQFETELVEEILQKFEQIGIDTSEWEYKFGDGNTAAEFIQAGIQSHLEKLNSDKNPEVCDATKAEESTEAGNKITPSIDYVYVPSELKDIKDDDIILFDNGETRRHSEESWPFAVATHKLKKVPLSSLISKGGAEDVEKLAAQAEYYKEHLKNMLIGIQNMESGIQTTEDTWGVPYANAILAAHFINNNSEALTQKAGDGWKEALEAQAVHYAEVCWGDPAKHENAVQSTKYDNAIEDFIEGAEWAKQFIEKQ